MDGTRRIELRVTPEEQRRITTAAEVAGVSVAEYLRGAAMRAG